MKFYPNELKVVRGQVLILVDRCKGCGFCVNYCPMEVLEVSQDFNAKGYHYPVVANPDKCINCGLCELLCPDFAIWSLFKEEKRVTEG